MNKEMNKEMNTICNDPYIYTIDNFLSEKVVANL